MSIWGRFHKSLGTPVLRYTSVEKSCWEKKSMEVKLAVFGLGSDVYTTEEAE